MNQVGADTAGGFYYCLVHPDERPEAMQDGYRHPVPADQTAHYLRRIGDALSLAIGFVTTLLVLLFSIALNAISRLQRPLLTLMLLTIASVGAIAMQFRMRR